MPCRALVAVATKRKKLKKAFKKLKELELKYLA
jgi:hypothetical protein